MCFGFSLCGKISVQNIIKRSPAKVIYLTSNFGQLAVGLRDLSQTEKKITVVKDEQIHKMTNIFTQNG